MTALTALLRDRTDNGHSLARLTQLVRDMDKTRHGRSDPVREVMARLGDRWSALILIILSSGTYRHAELRRLVALLSSEQNISQRMLTLRLRDLERDGFVLRTVTPTVPPRTDYELTEMGRQLNERLEQLIGWIGARDPEIRAARARFDTSE
jgi:DNA-binding HxlR family transcriptional regulator